MWMLAITQQDIRYARELADFTKLQPQVQILGDLKRFIVAADFLDRISPHHRQRMADRCSAGEGMLLKRRIIAWRDHFREKSPGAIDQLIAATQKHDIWMSAHEIDLNGKTIRQ